MTTPAKQLKKDRPSFWGGMGYPLHWGSSWG